MTLRNRLQRLVERLSLRAAVALAVSFGLATPALMATWHEIVSAETDAWAGLQHDTAVMADVLAISMRSALWQITPEQGRAIAQAMLRDPRVTLVQVATADGKPFIDVYRSVNALAPTVTERRGVTHEGASIGSVTVSLSSGPMLAGLEAERRATGWRLAGELLVAIPVILWVLNRWLLIPLHRVTVAAEGLSARRLEEPIVLHRADELGHLAQALDTTRLALREAFQQLERRNSELKAYADTLENRVDQRTIDLTESNERLTRTLVNLRATQRNLIESEKLASLGRLVAGIAHEMNTPIGNSITVVTELDEHYRVFIDRVAAGGIRRSEFDQFLDHGATGIGILRRNVERAAKLISHFKQVAIDQSSERRRTFDLALVVEETLSTLQHRFKRSPFVLHTELADSLMMDSYPGPLEQVIINLVDNSLVHAFKNRTYGTVTVRIERLNRQRVRLVVRDDGIGMAADTLEHLFDPFYSARADTDGGGGSGLGMSIVYSIVTSVLGGRIDVQSRPQEGSACIIDLPVEAPQFNAEQAAASGPAQ